MQHQSRYYKSMVFFVVLLTVLIFAVPVLADYLGPNRTVTTYVSYCRYVQKRCAQQKNGQWEWNTVEDWDCSHGDRGCSGGGGSCNKANNGARSCEREEGVREETVTYDPAMIVGTIQNCTSYNGWCGVTSPELALSANEPLTGYNILLIEGTLNGASFACQPGETSCAIPMIEGDNTFNYWALSSWGDSSLMGTTTVKVDTVPPEVTLNVSGTAGNQGWYKSPIQVAANALDATSGVATFEVAVDGGGYQAYTNMTPIPLNSDGVHTLQLRVVDNAGNVFEPPAQNFYIDTIPPTVNLPGSWQLGRNVPYDVVDEGSGLGALRIVIEDEDEKYAKVAWDEDHVSGRSYSQDIDWNGQFKDKTVAPPGTYLVWLKACDVAGNEHFELGKVIVPEPNYVGAVVLPTEEPAAVSQPPAPPAELSQLEEVSSLPTSPEGIKTTTTTHTFTLTSGSAGGMTSSSAATTSSSVLWGAAAAAAIGAATTYALETTRKRQEAEEAQAAQVRAQVAREKDERAKKQQKQKDNYEKQKDLQDAIDAYHLQKAKEALIEKKLTKLEEQEQANWAVAQAAIKKQQEQAASKAHIEKKIAQLDAQDNASWQIKNKDVQDLPTKLAGYFNSEKQESSGTVTRLGGPKVLAAPAPDPGPVERFWNWLKSIFTPRQKTSPLSADQMMQTQVANIIPTLDAQQIQTAQALSTLTSTANLFPTFTPTLTSTPTLVSTPTAVTPSAYIIDNNVHFRSDGSITASYNKDENLQCGMQVQISGGQKIADGKTWQQVTYNGKTGWISLEFLNNERPVCTNFASKYAKYPGAGETLIFTSLPFQADKLDYWWGFGNTTNAERLKCSEYESTGGWHNGLDYGSPFGTALIWNGNRPGTIVDLDGNKFRYLKKDSFIVIEAGGFHIIYGHNSAVADGLKEGMLVYPGDIVGYSGEHLHFEVRPVPPDGKTKSNIYINPLTFFESELQNQWVELFAGDYAPESGWDPLSLGYYQSFPATCP